MSKEEIIRAILQTDDEWSAMELLYQCYGGGEDSARIRELTERIDNALDFLIFSQKDEIFTMILELCVEYQHDAFLDGLRTGARLMQELTE